MATIGFSDRFLMNGYELSEWMQSFDGQSELEEKEFTVLNTAARQYILGNEDGTLECSGVFDADATNEDAIHNVLSTAFRARTDNVLTVGIGAFAVGSDCLMLDGCQVKYTRPIEAGEILTVDASFRSSNGINHGYFLRSAASAAGTHNGTGVDNAAASTNGGVLHVHLNNDTASDVDVKVQHSTDNSVWADLTGAAVNNLSAEHDSGSATVATGTTVNRYVRSVAVVTGGAVLNLTAAFARR
jgi:hypothetical protein